MIQKTPKEIRDELLQAFLELEAEYMTGPTTTSPEKRISYLHIDMCNSLLVALKSLEYRYRDDVPGMHKKKNYSSSMKKALNLISKYGELSNNTLQLKANLDNSGYLKNLEFLNDLRSR